MRIDENEMHLRIQAELDETHRPSAEFEAELFASADALLSRRRDLLLESDTASRKRRLRKERVLSSVSALAVLLSPTTQIATIAILATLAFLIRPQKARFPVPLPDFPRMNTTPSRYDAQWRAEREANEKEIENAHAETNGGI